MSRKTRTGALSALAIGAAVAMLNPATRDQEILEAASESELFADADKDLLPDDLEWILRTDPQQADSNGDDVSDFIEAVQGRLPGQGKQPTDSEARILVSVKSELGGDSVWMHLLCRMPSGKVGGLTWLEPYFDWRGIRVPVHTAVGRGRSEIKVLVDEDEGLLLRASVEMTNEGTLKRFLPCSVGAEIVIGGRVISSATYLMAAGDRPAAWMPISTNEGVLQTLLRGDVGDPFWSASRVCVLGLKMMGSAPGGVICQVDSATCVADGKLSCPPTCASSKGALMFFPDGLSTVVGGGTSNF